MHLRLVFPVFAALALRLAFLDDMEFKGDELTGVQTIRTLWDRGFSFLTGATPHSGISHSTGFFHLVKLLSLGAQDPVAIVASIALFNAAVLIFLLWLARRSEALTLTFAMCATSFALTLGSRKIWQPDLVAPFDALALGLFALALRDQESPRRKAALLVAGGFLLVMAGHMYSSGLGVVVTAGGALAAWLLATRRRREAGAWIGGIALGGLTFAPYFYLMATGAPGAQGQSGLPQAYSFGQFLDILPTTLTLPSPLAAYRLYVAPNVRRLLAGNSDVALWAFLFWTAVATAGWITLYWMSLVRIATRWREAIRDPLVVAGVATVIGITGFIFLGRVGNHLHYWFGSLPFAYYLIAWACSGEARLRKAAWACMGASFLCAAHFILLVHHLDGLPGEYWLAYSSPRNYFKTQALSTTQNN